ncbi:MAG: tetratricopeptide repeat protein, partial [bacterium]|nr:tetratricopeptide repeat protein [Candidatus Kapabacteria bacterium]
DPPFPLSRLRVRKQLLEIRASDLRFTVDESSELFRQTLPLDLDERHITALQKKTEGWIAGLQMAGLSLRGRTDVDEFIDAFTGADRYVLDYLVEEVLGNQSDETQSVMLDLSVLDRFNGALCEAVTGCADGVATLERLDEANLFLIPLDNHRDWYRYHKLFGDLLQHRLRQMHPDRIAELHKRASDWFESNGFIVESAMHALHSGDREFLLAKIDRHWRLLMREATEAELKQIVGDAFTHEQILESARLSVIRSMAAFFERDFNLMVSTLDATDRLVDADAADYRDVAGINLMMRGARARDMSDNEEAVEFIQRAIEVLPHRVPGSSDYLYYASEPMLLNVLGTTYDQMRDYDRAEMKFHEAIRLARSANDDSCVVISIGNLGKMLLRRGDYVGALRYTEELEAYRGTPAFTNDRAEASPYQIRARIALERNELEVARNLANEGIAVAGPPDQHLELYRTLFMADEALGDYEAADVTIERAERVPLNPSIAKLSIIAQMMRSQLRARRGNADAAADVAALYDEWLDRHMARSSEEISDTQLPLLAGAMFTRARIELLRGQSAAAIDALERVVRMFKSAEQVAVVIEAHVLLAVARERARDIDGAQSSMLTALELASGPAIIRPFAIEGSAVSRLLQHLVSKRRPDIARIPSDYLRKLLDACNINESLEITAPQSRTLVVGELQLTTREQEILNLLALGYSNQKIGDKLYVSVNTIKTHLSNLFDKLGVRSRVEALARAREEELI